tara:strand:- start:253 stop:552 length:300 start_codon:yes stop_codon:yes gene_type:complete
MVAMARDCTSPPLGTPPKRQRVQNSPASVVTPSAALLTKSASIASNLSSSSSVQSASLDVDLDAGLVMAQLLELAEHIKAHGADRIPQDLLQPVRTPQP